MPKKAKKRVSRRSWITIVLALVALGIVATVLRQGWRIDQEIPAGDSAWQLSLEGTATANARNSAIAIATPWDTPRVRVFEQQRRHPGLHMQRQPRPRRGREITLVATAPGRYVFGVDFMLHVRVGTTSFILPNIAPLSSEGRERLLLAEPGIQSDAPIAAQTIEVIATDARDPDALFERIAAHVIENTLLDRTDGNEDAAAVLDSRHGTTVGRARAGAALYRAARMPARLVAGVILGEGQPGGPHVWLEVYHRGDWTPVDPEYGYVGTLPASYLPLRRGGERIVEAIGDIEFDANWSVVRRTLPPEIVGGGERRWSDVVNINRLPLAVRSTLAFLLLLPFGVLITTFLRGVVGIRPYGTFSATLLALAALAVDAVTAAVLTAVIGIIGLGGRTLMPGLNLPRTPRLAIVFTLVAISMTLGLSLLSFFDLAVVEAVVLLPIVVMATLVDRIYAVADESGPRVAMTRLVWTLVAGALCFLVFVNEGWGYWLVGHPEIHLFTIAAIIGIGRFRGRTLADFPAFVWLNEPAAPAQPESPEGDKRMKRMTS